MLVITGPGRSGTSVLALFCKEMGYDPGGAWHDPINAGLEYARVVQINDALLRETRETGVTTSTLAAHAGEMRALDLPVVKDPRFTFHPATLRAWHSIRPDLKVLLTYRKPEHSLASRQRSVKNLKYRDQTHPDRLRCSLADTIETLLELETPFEMLLFPHFLTRFNRVHAAFQNLGLSMDKTEAERVWSRVVDHDKVHFKPESSQAAEGSTSTRRKARWNPFAKGGE